VFGWDDKWAREASSSSCFTKEGGPLLPHALTTTTHHYSITNRTSPHNICIARTGSLLARCPGPARNSSQKQPRPSNRQQHFPRPTPRDPLASNVFWSRHGRRHHGVPQCLRPACWQSVRPHVRGRCLSYGYVGERGWGIGRWAWEGVPWGGGRRDDDELSLLGLVPAFRGLLASNYRHAVVAAVASRSSVL
jgi:hypothetical protein